MPHTAENTRRRARPPRRAALASLSLFASVGLAVVGVAGCGGTGDGGGSSSAAGGPKLADAAALPQPANRSFRVLIGNLTQGPVLAPSVSDLQPGTNRFGFGLFDRANRQIADMRVGLYVAKGLDDTVYGPYLARFEPIDVRGPYRSKTSADDPNAARSIYVASVHFRGAGGYIVSAVGALGNKLVATSPSQVVVRDRSTVPRVGDKAIRVHTPTVGSVGGQIARIDTRIPPDTMHNVDLADALDRHRPVLLLFATPALCQSRVCGPVTDVAEQVKGDYGARMEFIHMEIYNDNDVSKGKRPQVRAWGLKTEPWAFAINSSGRIAARLDGAFSVGELSAAVRKALR